MLDERWLPAQYEILKGMPLGRLVHSGPEWQMYRSGREQVVLIASNDLADRWIETELLPVEVLDSFAFGGNSWRFLLSGVGLRLEPVAGWSSPTSKADGLAFAVSLRETRKIHSTVPLHDAIYAERHSRLLPTWTVSETSTDEEVLGRWLTGGVKMPITSFCRLSELCDGMPRKDVADIVMAAGFPVPSETESAPNAKSGEADGEREFQLPGRPELETFFREHVIDIVENEARYQALGIDFPAGIVLHGPPGCGKSYAVERLVECLDWPMFPIDSNSVGSPYIHETSRKVGQVGSFKYRVGTRHEG